MRQASVKAGVILQVVFYSARGCVGQFAKLSLQGCEEGSAVFVQIAIEGKGDGANMDAVAVEV
jgi:hypothetical protein